VPRVADASTLLSSGRDDARPESTRNRREQARKLDKAVLYSSQLRGEGDKPERLLGEALEFAGSGIGLSRHMLTSQLALVGSSS
jgi:hypothetical protein